MTSDEHYRKMRKFFQAKKPKLKGRPDNVREALYALNEVGFWPDDVECSMEQLFMCWKVVEKLREIEFPRDLMM